MGRLIKKQKAYESIEFDEDAVLEGVKRFYGTKKRRPTSVALDETLIKDLRAIAKAKAIPYQSLMRMLLRSSVNQLKRSVVG
jgi:predicted DNA binding CopG/RHH family protein